MRSNIPHIVRSGSWWKLWSNKSVSRKKDLYTHSPLFLLSAFEMGHTCNLIAQKVYKEIGFETSHPPFSSKHYNHQYKYDFHDVTNNLRVEVKSASLAAFRSSSNIGWKLYFQKVKLHLFDKLILVGHFPDGINVWEWDGLVGLSKVRKTTKDLGHSIALYHYLDADHQNPNRSNFKSSGGKLLKSCSFDALADCFPKSWSVKDVLYKNTPFSNMSPSARGFLFEDLSKEIWQELFGSISNLKEVTIRGINSYDFHDNLYDRRTEVKSSAVQGGF